MKDMPKDSIMQQPKMQRFTRLLEKTTAKQRSSEWVPILTFLLCKNKYYLQCRTCEIEILKIPVKWKNLTYWDLFPIYREKMSVCYLDISIAEDRYHSILIRQRVILANNF